MTWQSKVVHYQETDLDETSRLILMEHETKGENHGPGFQIPDLTLTQFAVLMKESHAEVGLATIAYQWRKWHGDYTYNATHDFRTGEIIRKYNGPRR